MYLLFFSRKKKTRALSGFPNLQKQNSSKEAQLVGCLIFLSYIMWHKKMKTRAFTSKSICAVFLNGKKGK